MGSPAALLDVLRRSQQLGFLGPVSVADHVAHSRAFVVAAERIGRAPSGFLDLGSGGGVPGLVLAVEWSAAIGVLLDSQMRRVRFLEAAIAELGGEDRVRALHGRAEEIAHQPEHRGRYDVVTARSFGPPSVTAECAAGFLVPHGALIVAEPPGAPADRWPASGLSTLGLEDDGPISIAGATVRRLVLTGDLPAALPRRPAAIHRRPLF